MAFLFKNFNELREDSMKKILMSLILIVSVFVSSFGADKSLEDVQKRGYFIVGLDATFAPMGYRDESGEIVGIDVDLAKEVAKRIGVEVRFNPREWDAIIFDLRSKNIDMVWNGMTITPARAKQVAFTKPYLSDNQIIFTRKEGLYNDNY